MKCPYCFRVIPDGTTKCPSCLQPISEQQATQAAIQQEEDVVEVEGTAIRKGDVFNYDEETRNSVLALYALSLIGLIFPFGNILFPKLFMRFYTSQYTYDRNIHVQKILHFQSIFSIFYYPYIAAIVIQLLLYGFSLLALLLLLFSFFMVCINAFFTGQAIIAVFEGKDYTFPIHT